MLRAFWSRHAGEPEQVAHAAREYGPYALVMVGIITAELAVMSASLVARHSALAWIPLVATALSCLATWWTEVCRRASFSPPERAGATAGR